jgi:hypothetical protein
MHPGPSTLGAPARSYDGRMGDKGSFSEQLREHTRAFFTNWQEYEAGFWTKAGLTLKNRTRSVVTLKGCCGNHGQPGC